MTRSRCVFCDCDLKENEKVGPNLNPNRHNFETQVQKTALNGDRQKAVLLKTFSKYFCANFSGYPSFKTKRHGDSLCSQNLPFCSTCQSKMTNLSELDSQLERLQLTIRFLVATLSGEIINSISNNKGQGQEPSPQVEEHEHDEYSNGEEEEEEERLPKRRKRSHSSSSSFDIYNPKMVQDYRRALYQSFSPNVVVSRLQFYPTQQVKPVSRLKNPVENQFEDLDKKVPNGFEVDSFFQVFSDQSEEVEEDEEEAEIEEDDIDNTIRNEKENQASITNNENNHIEEGEEVSPIIKTEPTIETEQHLHHHPPPHLINENLPTIVNSWHIVQNQEPQEHDHQVDVKKELPSEISFNETEEHVEQDPLSLDHNYPDDENNDVEQDDDEEDYEEEQEEEEDDEEELVTGTYSIKCGVCSQYLHDFKHMHKHMQAHIVKGEDDRPYKCQYDDCFTAGFTKAGNLTRHEKIYHADKKTNCPVCNVALYSKWQTAHHMLRHNKLSVPQYNCGLCDIHPFNQIRLLTNHMLKFHSSSSTSSSSSSTIPLRPGKIGPKSKTNPAQVRGNNVDYVKYPVFESTLTHSIIKSLKRRRPLGGPRMMVHPFVPEKLQPSGLIPETSGEGQIGQSMSTGSRALGFSCTFANCTRSFRFKKELYQHLTHHMM